MNNILNNVIDPPNGKVNSFIFDVINAKATQIADTVNCFADTLFSLFPTIKDAAIVKAAIIIIITAIYPQIVGTYIFPPYPSSTAFANTFKNSIKKPPSKLLR